MEQWLTRSHGQLNFYMTQIITGHGCFNKYLWRIKKIDAPNCSHCHSLCDDARHTLAICPAWEEEREKLANKIGYNFDLIIINYI
jgi:hypothetical protein